MNKTKKTKLRLSKIILLVFLFSIVTLISSGSSGYAALIFQADFDHGDTVGNIPGDPVIGTRSLYNVTWGSNSFTVDNTALTGSSGKYLVIHSEAVSGQSPCYRAFPIVGPYTTGAYKISWRVASLQFPSSASAGGSLSDDLSYPNTQSFGGFWSLGQIYWPS